MRAEKTAALANFGLVLAIALALMAAAWLSNRNDAVAIAYPVKHALKTAAYVVLGLLMVTPLAAIASWRTWIHAQRIVAREGSAWRGIAEAAAFGFLLTLPFTLPILIGRLFVPERWSRGEAFLLGIGYLGAYGLIGAIIGLALGLLLFGMGFLVLRVALSREARRG